MINLHLELVDEEQEDMLDYVSSLFAIDDYLIRNKNINPLVRLNELNIAKTNVLGKLKDELLKGIDDIYQSTVKRVERYYLMDILQDLLCLEEPVIYEKSVSENNVLDKTLQLFGYFDSADFYKTNKTSFPKFDDGAINKKLLQEVFCNPKEFEYSYLFGDLTCDARRNAIIERLLDNDCNRYLHSFKEKIQTVSGILFRHILFSKLNELENHELEKLVLYLVYEPKETSYLQRQDEVFEQAKNLISNQCMISLVEDKQKNFCEALRLIKESLSDEKEQEVILTQDDRSLISLLRWLKNLQEEKVKMIKALSILVERKRLFADQTPNVLVMYICSLREEVADLLGLPVISHIVSGSTESLNLPAFEKIHILCNDVREKVLSACKKAALLEDVIVKKITAERRTKKIKRLLKQTFLFLLPFIIIATLKFSFDYLNDIERIYKNDFYKVAKVSMESLPYPSELKDSLNPGINETRQKQRLDFIRDLNSRYFKVLSVFLSPHLHDSILPLAIPDEIKNEQVIQIVRKKLTGIITKKEWDENYENLFGQNVLTQLRAYGAICNFLLPVLGHQVLKDTRGMPVIKNGQIQIYSAPSEKELLNEFEPKVYIGSCTTLLERIQKRKSELFKEYKNKQSKELTLTLKAVAILESRLSDLIEKIKQRHDYIKEHNTYRAPLE